MKNISEKNEKINNSIAIIYNFTIVGSDLKKEYIMAIYAEQVTELDFSAAVKHFLRIALGHADICLPGDNIQPCIITLYGYPNSGKTFFITTLVNETYRISFREGEIRWVFAANASRAEQVLVALAHRGMKYHIPLIILYNPDLYLGLEYRTAELFGKLSQIVAIIQSPVSFRQHDEYADFFARTHAIRAEAAQKKGVPLRDPEFFIIDNPDAVVK